MHPLRISASMKAGVVGRDGCTNAVGPHSPRIRMQTWQRSRVSRAGCTNAQQSGQMHRLQDSRMAIAPKMAIADVHHTCHIVQIKCTRKHNYIASPSPQFPVPQRGRKRLSREAILRMELALEWPELVQIGRCKVQWLPSAPKKRNLTSFC